MHFLAGRFNLRVKTTNPQRDRGPAHPDHPVVEHIRSHADQLELAAALAQQLVPGRERDQVREPRRHRDAVTDQVRDGVAQWDDGGDGIAQPTGTGACTGASTKS